MKLLKVEDYSKNYGGVYAIINDTRKGVRGVPLGDTRVSFGSVKGYALYNKEDPYKEIANALKRNHDLAWINLIGTCISGDPCYYAADTKKWANVPHLNLGDVVEFEDGTYIIEGTHNNNFKLVPVDVQE